jgi:hypothetical protein
MRKICTLILLVVFPAPVLAAQLTTEEILAKTRRVQQAPKSKAELEGVTLWCIDSLMVPILLDAVRLQTRALAALKTNQAEEANQLIKTAEANKDSGRALAKSMCAPRN